jgi:hypothetical protein
MDGKDHLGNLSIDMKIILKLILLRSLKIQLPKHIAGHWEIVLQTHSPFRSLYKVPYLQLYISLLCHCQVVLKQLC